MRLLTSFKGLAAGLGAGFVATAAFAQEALPIIGQPVNKALGFQPAATEVARDLQGLDHMLLVIISVIVAFVTALLLYVIFRFAGKRNPKPATFTHNTPLEIVWTLVPIIILVIIGAFSLPVLFKEQEIPVAELTIKATGNQWYWSYEYPKEGISFDANMIGSPATGGDNRLTPAVEEQLKAAGMTKEQFLLATDTAVVVPVNKIVVVTVTGSDVIHSWKVPAFGVMQDGVPGRLAQTWFKAEQEGIYFGQCSELCGIAHAYMPIMIKVVSQEAYDKWVVEQGGTVAQADLPGAVPGTVTVAAN